MSSPAATSDTSSLSPPPSTLSSPSPAPYLEPSPPPKPVARRKPKSRDTAKPKSPKKKGKDGTKVTLKLKQPQSKDKEGKEKTKKPMAKPREPKIEPIPRSVVDNFDVPLVCLFRSKFRALFSGTSELGPQDVEEGVSVEGELEGKLEEFVCRICTLIGNRRKNVEHENVGKILQETVDSCVEKIGFRKDGINTSPMLNITYASMDWDARLQLLRALVHWALLSSDAVRQIIDDGYKVPQNSRVEREELDVNTGLGVLPLATVKGDNYYLIEGRDTRFRIYRCTNPYHKIINISSVAEDKPSLFEFAEKMSTGSKPEQELGTTIHETIIARIEAAEQRRVKAEQAAMRLAMWKAAAPVYNTRTRGKRVDYTELEKDSGSEDEEDDRGGRRSERNREREVVEYTASGRMVKRSRVGNGVEVREANLKDNDDEESEEEMEWSVYSDKGEEMDGVDDEEEGEEEDYDLDGRTLVVNLRIPTELLRTASTLGECIPVNGMLKSPDRARISSETSPAQRSPQNATKPYQQPYRPQQPAQFSHYPPPRGYPPTVPRHSPSQTTTTAVPLPFAGSASPPVASRPVQLSPQPIPQTFPQGPSHAYRQPPQYYPHQMFPQAYQQPISTQSFRQSPYSVAQFQQQPSPPQSIQTSPRPYTSTNGIGHASPTPSARPFPGSPGTAWSPPRPFGAAPQDLGVSMYGNPPASSTTAVQVPQYPTQASPRQPTWATAIFESNDVVNGARQKAEISPQISKLSPITATETTLNGAVNGEMEKRGSLNGSGTGDGHIEGDQH